VVENNRSKARLLEAVHQLTEKVKDAYYFPAYELVIDVLRDHRWYDIDLVHPNFAATSYVFEQFEQLTMSEETRKLNDEVYQLTLARRHRPRFPETAAHQKFLAETAAREALLKQQLPWLQLNEKYLCPTAACLLNFTPVRRITKNSWSVTF
jgi:hypothetical protein